MGETLVERKITEGRVKHHLNTKTEFRILFSFKVEYDLEETFENGVLISGTSFNTLNGSVQKETKMKKLANTYELVVDGITTTVDEPQITESVGEIYFEEPFDGKEVYSAYFARYLTFEKEGDHKYSLTSPDGTNVYTYENGICTRVDITRDFASFSQVLQPELLAAVRNKKILNQTK